ncbi:hypothetical protein [Gaetbulibacter saemankumensis]|nr:hypothetical protein [Gaetbulibacter saemankumensis]
MRLIVYVTSKTKKLKQETQQEIDVVLEPRSISTLTGTLKLNKE